MKTSLAAVCLCLFLACCGAKPPKDADAVKQFDEHRQAYEHLVQMLGQDGNVVQVVTSGVVTDTSAEVKSANGLPEHSPAYAETMGLTRQRYDEYVSTLRATGARDAAYDENEYYFLADREGSAGKGWSVDVVYRPTPPVNQVPSLDSYDASKDWGTAVCPAKQPNCRQRHGAYRHMEGNWYLFILAR